MRQRRDKTAAKKLPREEVRRLLRKLGKDPSDPATVAAFERLPLEAQKHARRFPLGPQNISVDAFTVHGKKNPEGGIRRPREAEYAEIAIKTIYPKGAPDNLGDDKLAGIVNEWLDRNTDWTELQRGPISRWTIRRVRKLSRG